jgi:hypothetical protein
VILKAIDLALMSEHLTVHKGILHKLQTYYCYVKDPNLKQIIYEQFIIMRNHVQVMLALMDPKLNEQITIAALNQIQPVDIPCQQVSIPMGEQEITLELQHTAKTMASDNFSSALRMKAGNIRDIHVQMALQQVQIKEKYSDIINKMGWGYVPESSMEEQLKTLEKFKEFYHIK